MERADPPRDVPCNESAGKGSGPPRVYGNEWPPEPTNRPMSPSSGESLGAPKQAARVLE